MSKKAKKVDHARPPRRAFGLVGLLVTAGLSYLAASHIYIATDWWKLRNYQPSAQVSGLANSTTMTDAARRYFYINHPAVEDKATFRSNCDKFGETTIVLGCYQSNMRGIYILSVDDERLEGVEQVTAAHEMLHAAYDRLSKDKKAEVNRWLQDFADNQLQDARVKKILKNYETTEPGQQLNEMHSIFGTEVANLSPQLEQYYRQYFTDRQTVAAFAGSYQGAFTSRQEAIQKYDNQLKTMSKTINDNKNTLVSQEKQLDDEGRKLQNYRASGRIDTYNQGVEPYNTKIDAYNKLLEDTKTLIDQYNAIVAQRNQLAQETLSLQQAIDSSSLPATK